MTWNSYFRPYHLGRDSLISGLVKWPVSHISGHFICNLTLKFLVLLSMTWLTYIWSCYLRLDSLISGFVFYDMTLLFPVLSLKTWLSYWWSCHPWIDSIIFWSCQLKKKFFLGLVISNLTLLFLVLSLPLDSLISGLVTYDLTYLYLVLLSTIWLSYFGSCLLWDDSLISGLVTYNLNILLLVLSSMTWPYYFWSCQLQFFGVLSLATWLSYSGFVSYDLTLLFLVLSFNDLVSLSR